METGKKVILGALGVIALGAGVYGWAQFRTARALSAEVEAVKRQHQHAIAAAAEIEGRIRAESTRAKATEEDNTTLAAALEKARTSLAAVPPAAARGPITEAEVEARFNRARDLARNGDPREALRELLWLYDEGMVASSRYSGSRNSVLTMIMGLEARLPEVRAAVMERRDRAQRRIQAGADAEIPDFVYLNRALGATQLTLQVFDQIPPTDRRRSTMAIYAADLLLEQRRYTDIVAGKSYSTISSSFELDTNRVSRTAPAPEAEKRQRDYTVTRTAKDIEVLAGAGQLDNARDLARRLLAYDGSDATRALIQRHAERAGQPGLLAAGAGASIP